MQDEVRSNRLRVRRVKRDNVPDLGTKALSKAVISKHYLALKYLDMDEEGLQVAQQDVAMFRDFGSAGRRTQQVTMPSNSGSSDSSAGPRGHP